MAIAGFGEVVTQWLKEQTPADGWMSNSALIYLEPSYWTVKEYKEVGAVGGLRECNVRIMQHNSPECPGVVFVSTNPGDTEVIHVHGMPMGQKDDKGYPDRLRLFMRLANPTLGDDNHFVMTDDPEELTWVLIDTISEIGDEEYRAHVGLDKLLDPNAWQLGDTKETAHPTLRMHRFYQQGDRRYNVTLMQNSVGGFRVQGRVRTRNGQMKTIAELTEGFAEYNREKLGFGSW